MAPIDGNGVLEVDVHDFAVTIHGRNCRYRTTYDDQQKTKVRELGEVEITIPLSACQIYWHIAERVASEESERSVYFKG